MNSTPQTLRELSCADDYDPDSMPVAKAREHIASFLRPVTATERINVRAALGRVLAEDILSPLDVPAHDNSAMDGYALKYDDLRADASVTLNLVDETAFAGRPIAHTLKSGDAARIMTGGVMPQGADTVVMQEVVTREGRAVTIPALRDAKIRARGTNTRKAGEDLRKGSVALERGWRINPAEMGMIASLGINEISVYRKLRVAFFSTGDELRTVGQPLGPGEIYDSNRYTIHGMLTRVGCDVLDLGVVVDELSAVERAFAVAADCADVVITSGGVSVGEADYIKPVLAKLGEVLFWKIAMKPGRPFAYGRLGHAHFFGLPGNPVSVMATFYQFVREPLMRLSGQTRIAPLPTFSVRLKTSVKKALGRTEFQRAIYALEADGSAAVTITGNQGSGVLSSMSRANCFVILGDDVGDLDAGALVDVQMFEGMI